MQVMLFDKQVGPVAKGLPIKFSFSAPLAPTCPAVRARPPAEDPSQLVHHGGVVAAGRDAPDLHHLHRLGLLGLAVPLVAAGQLEGLGQPSVAHLDLATGAVVAAVGTLSQGLRV